MDAILSIGNGGIRSSVRQVTGRAGLGTYRVEFQLDWTPTKPADYAGAHLTFGGELEASFTAGARLPLAQVQPIYVVAFPDPERGPTHTPVNLGANILPEQLEALERQRNGGPVIFTFQLQGTIIRSPEHEPTIAAPAIQGFWGSLEHQLKAAQWVEVLQNWNYAQGFLLQVPAVASSYSVKTVRAKDDLQQAVNDIAEGRYRHAVAACRDAFENAYGPEDKGAHPELEYKVANLREAGKDARFWLVRQALWAVTHAAKHSDATTRDIEWERRDAVAVVTMLAALLEQDPPI